MVECACMLKAKKSTMPKCITENAPRRNENYHKIPKQFMAKGLPWNIQEEPSQKILCRHKATDRQMKKRFVILSTSLLHIAHQVGDSMDLNILFWILQHIFRPSKSKDPQQNLHLFGQFSIRLTNEWLRKAFLIEIFGTNNLTIKAPLSLRVQILASTNF